MTLEDYLFVVCSLSNLVILNHRLQIVMTDIQSPEDFVANYSKLLPQSDVTELQKVSLSLSRLLSLSLSISLFLWSLSSYSLYT